MERLAELDAEVSAAQFPHDGKRVWGMDAERASECPISSFDPCV
jgi:hypothetical protein